MIQSIWEEFLKIVREEVGSRVVETWFKAVSIKRWDAIEKVIFLTAPNTFVRSWLEKHYIALFQTHLGRLLSVATVRVVIASVDEKKDEVLDSADDTTQENSRQLTKKTYKAAHVVLYKPNNIVSDAKQSLERFGHINKNYVFETFVVGPSNSLAYAASQAIAQKPGHLYNPMFIYGGAGLGKTHLLHAIGNSIKENNKNAIVLYQTADRFVNEFINAIRFDKMHRFQKKYQAVDVLLVDDIQFISNKETTQEAFFHIFNSLYDARKQIVFSSDTYPHNIEGIAERLRSRLTSGLVTDIHIPRIETKIAILKKKAELGGETLADDVAQFLATCVVSNVRELEGVLIRVIAFAHLTKQSITLELAQKVLMHAENSKNKAVELKSVIKLMEKYFFHSIEELKSKKRNKELVLARQVSMYLMKRCTNKSLRDIGTYLGGRNHATVMHALTKVEQQIQKNSKLQRQIRVIEDELKQ